MKRCAIIGSGPAGSLACSFLATSTCNRWEINIFERENEERVDKPVGAGLLLQPAAIEVLNCIGAAEGIIQDGHQITKLLGQNAMGWKVMDLNYKALGDQFFGVGIQRHTLSYHLRKSWKDSSDITVKFGTTISEIEAVGSGNLYNKAVHIKDQNNVSYGPFDLVIVATGRHCTLRDKELVKIDKRYPWGAFWAIVPMMDHPEIRKEHLQQFYKDTSKMLGFLPSGRLPGSDREYVSIFWSVHEKERTNFRERGLQGWKDEVYSLAPIHSVLTNAITDINQLTWAEYSDVHMKQMYSSKYPVVYIGDCGHATSPQLGMGVTASCLDAAALAESLNSSNSIKEALSHFDAKRKSTLRFYQTFSRLLTPLFQSNLGRAVGLVRDVSLMVPNYLPWFDKQTALTLCGYKNGLFTSNQPRFPKKK